MSWLVFANEIGDTGPSVVGEEPPDQDRDSHGDVGHCWSVITTSARGRRHTATVLAFFATMAMVTTRANVSKPIWQPQPGPLSTPWTGQVGPDNALPEYPRPQLSRHRWLNLNGLWDYAGLPGTATAVPSEVRYGERILVPYPQESALSGIHRHDDQMFYRRDFEVPQDWRGQRVLLHFGTVDQVATVWVNGQNVAAHSGGYTEFSADITGALHESGSQQIVVRAEDLLRPRPVSGGKAARRARRNLLHRFLRHLADGVAGARSRSARRQAGHHPEPGRIHRSPQGFRGYRRAG
jgi:hypothetical protein